MSKTDETLTAATPTASAADLQDERLLRDQGLAAPPGRSCAGSVAATSARCRCRRTRGHLGGVPEPLSPTSCPRATSSTSRCSAPRSAPSPSASSSCCSSVRSTLGRSEVSVVWPPRSSGRTHVTRVAALARAPGRARGRRGGGPAVRAALHPVRRPELRDHPRRPARLPRPAAAHPRAETGRSTCPTPTRSCSSPRRPTCRRGSRTCSRPWLQGGSSSPRSAEPHAAGRPGSRRVRSR